MDHPCHNRTKTGRPKTDEEALSKVDIPFVKKYIALEKLRKARGTNLKGIQKETVNGFLHSIFELNTARTYRSSSSHPNFQNFPVRDPKIAKLIRRCFIPREGGRLVEIDYGGIEVKVAACYHKDPVMLEYINDPTKDMHRDMAAQCFKCEPGQVDKSVRYCGKNMFVFPQFYGAFWRECAESLWDAIDRMQLELPDGTPMRKHLARKGITDLGQAISHYEDSRGTSTTKQGSGPGRIEARSGFYKHISNIETDFWENRFKQYDKWRKEWYQDYLEKGYFDTITGFQIAGVYKRNEVINYPVQGSAFHCLLWSLIRLVKLIRKYKMKTKIVGQIHDSLLLDVPTKELHTILEMCKDVMTQQIRKAWPWIIVPLEVEVEVTPVNGSWFDKAPWTTSDGK